MDEEGQKDFDPEHGAETDTGSSAKKAWTLPRLTHLADLSQAKVGRGAATDFKLKGFKNPPGQQS
jgi:hypothetical protein